jgi:hypothetical protein
MFRARRKSAMKKLVLLLAGLAAVLVTGVTGSAATSPAITRVSIDGAKLGLSGSAYKQLLGSAVSLTGTNADPAHPEDYSRLYFGASKMEVYFQGKVDKAIVITTWNKRFRTAAGVGPCSTVKQLKRAYGRRLKPNAHNIQGGNVYGYDLGKSLFFAVGDLFRVTAVALHVGGLDGYVGYVALNEVNCS